MADDVASPGKFALLAALLDHDGAHWRSEEMPPLGHWLLFPPEARQSALGLDGHPARDDSDLPRRMWAGSRVQFLLQVPLGADVTLDVQALSSVEKDGKSGRMRFETLRKRVLLGGHVAIEEEQDIVYRQSATPGASARPPAPALPVESDGERYSATTSALFRYSALTFNAHRIHYDRDYATGEEGYPGLVVHGPFLATLLMDRFLRANPRSPVRNFEFRALRPVFDGEPFQICVKGSDLEIVDQAGGMAMTAAIAR